jgi:hypothetical protein
MLKCKWRKGETQNCIQCDQDYVIRDDQPSKYQGKEKASVDQGFLCLVGLWVTILSNFSIVSEF